MNAPQVINSVEGTPEYVLIPVAVYQRLRKEIEREISGLNEGGSDRDYLPFLPEDYISNPIALARIKVRMTQAELARRMGVSQAYVSKIEAQARVSAKLLEKVRLALQVKPSKARKTPVPMSV
jgi:DNA-binding XRE family transcriptional regulator